MGTTNSAVIRKLEWFKRDNERSTNVAITLTEPITIQEMVNGKEEDITTSVIYFKLGAINAWLDEHVDNYCVYHSYMKSKNSSFGEVDLLRALKGAEISFNRVKRNPGDEYRDSDGNVGVISIAHFANEIVNIKLTNRVVDLFDELAWNI